MIAINGHDYIELLEILVNIGSLSQAQYENAINLIDQFVNEGSKLVFDTLDFNVMLFE